MAIEYLKKGLDEKQRIEDNDKVKKIVEETLCLSLIHISEPTRPY